MLGAVSDPRAARNGNRAVGPDPHNLVAAVDAADGAPLRDGPLHRGAADADVARPADRVERERSAWRHLELDAARRGEDLPPVARRTVNGDPAAPGLDACRTLDAGKPHRARPGAHVGAAHTCQAGVDRAALRPDLQ